MVMLAQSVSEEFFRWQPHPEVWALVLGMAGLYVYMVRVIGPTVVAKQGGVAATAANKRWFALGIIVLWLAADWPMHDIAEEYLYSVHMVQHMLLTFILPPVMLLATPEWLARLVLQGKVGQIFLKFARPVPAAVLFNAAQLLTHWKLVVNASVENGPLHYGLHALVVTTAIAVWMPVAGPLPEYRISVPAQCIHLFLTSIVPTVPAAWLALADGSVYSAYDHGARLWDISVTTDQQAAGLIMKLIGGGYLWLVILFLFTKWVVSQDRGTNARRVTVGDDGTVLAVEGDQPLTVDDIQQAFDQAGPAPEERSPTP